MEQKSSKCPICGGDMVFNESKNKMICLSCSHENNTSSAEKSENEVNQNKRDILRQRYEEAKTNNDLLKEKKKKLLELLSKNGDKKTVNSALIILGKKKGHTLLSIIMMIAGLIIGAVLHTLPSFLLGAALIIAGGNMLRYYVNMNFKAENYLKKYHSDYEELNKLIAESEKVLKIVTSELNIYNSQN